MKNPLTSIETEVKKYILKQGLCSKGDKLLLAVSGGADSMAMLHILNELKSVLGISLCAAHFDHGTREGASTREGNMVEQVCAGLAVPCIRGKAEIDAFAKGNFENEARKARYAFLREAARKEGCNLIATAHHRDDQAETVLLQLIRGCGTDGLAAIRPKLNELIRPLLCLSREDIEIYCREREIAFAMDSSNADISYRRNRLRLQLLPQLAELNPAVSEALSQTADICRKENDYINRQALAEYARLKTDNGLGFAELRLLPLALQRRIVRIYFAEQFDIEISFTQTEAVLALTEGSHVRLPDNLFAFLWNGKLIAAADLPQNDEPFVYNELKIGSYDLGHSFSCCAELLTYEGEQGKDILWLPQEFLPRLSWRGRKEGDKMYIKGMEGRKSVKAIMNEAKLPLAERMSLPLLLIDEEIIWLPFLKAAPLPLPKKGEKAIRIQICRK